MASYVRSRKSLSNASRSLHRIIHSSNKSLPVPISSVLTPIRVSRRRRVVRKPWPVLHLSDWLQTGFSNPYNGFYFLGGCQLNSLQQAEAILSDFWSKQERAEGQKPKDPARTIPFYIHGDEGRGQLRRPFLVVSFQPVIGWTGDGDNVNCKKYFGY